MDLILKTYFAKSNELQKITCAKNIALQIRIIKIHKTNILEHI